MIFEEHNASVCCKAFSHGCQNLADCILNGLYPPATRKCVRNNKTADANVYVGILRVIVFIHESTRGHAGNIFSWVM